MNALNPDEDHRRKPWAMLISIFVLGLIVADLLFLGRFTPAASVDRPLTPPSGQPIAALFTTPRVAVGQPAPDFTLSTLGGNQVALMDFRGQPILINFWATWCSPCRLEMPGLVRAYEAHKTDGFVILAVNLTAQDSAPAIKAFVEEFKMTFPVLLDRDGKVANELYQLRGLPTSIFVDRAGRIVRVQLGVMTGEQIDQFVGEILQ